MPPGGSGEGDSLGGSVVGVSEDGEGNSEGVGVESGIEEGDGVPRYSVGHSNAKR